MEMSKLCRKVITSEGGPPRSEDVPQATGDERNGRRSTDWQDEVPASKPYGSAGMEGTKLGKSTRKLANKLQIGTWNVRGMSLGKLEVVKNEMKRLELDILGTSEMKWTGQGYFTSDSHTVYYSGKNRVTGTAFIVKNNIARAVTGYNPVSDRVISLRLSAKPCNINLIQVYAPTTSASDEEIEDFYAQLDATIGNISKKEVTMVMGDFNAKIGQSSDTDIVGTYGLGTRNEAGDRLVQFCSENHMCISNTFFKVHPRRLFTWTSPDGTTKNQIDYFLCPKRWRNSVTSVKTRPGADCGTDHQLLVAKIVVRLKTKKRKAVPTRYDIDNIPEEYTMETENRFKALFLDEQEPDEMWQEISKIMIEEAKSHIPLKPKTVKTTWLSDEAIKVAKTRRKAKAKGDREQVRKMQSVFQRLARRDRKVQLEKKCQDIEEDNKKGRTRDMFKAVKETKGKFNPKRGTLKNRKGKTIMDGEEIKGRWAEYAEDLYKADQLTEVDVPIIGDVEVEPPILREEIEWCLKALSNHKSPGIDNIPTEMIKAAGESGIAALHKLCNSVWNTGIWPKQWKQSVYVPIYKKGDPQECSNYRTIALVSHGSKLLLKILQKRLEPFMEQVIPDEQAGFRRARGTRDHISNIRRIMETAREYQKNVYMCFIDYSKAFDCVDHHKLWQVLGKMGVPQHLVYLLRKLYESQEATVRTEYGNSEWFPVGKGVRQGCILSPYLFNMYAEFIMREANIGAGEAGLRVGGRKVDNLRYADDTTLIAESMEDLTKLIYQVKKESEKLGLRLNVKKTKVMTTGDIVNCSIDGEQLEVIESFVFLGAQIVKDGSCEAEIRRRIALGRKAMSELNTIMKDRGIPIQTKVRIISTMVFPIVTYGSESWVLKKADERRLEAFEMWCWRRALCVPWIKKVSNSLILTWLGNADPPRSLLQSIRKLQLSYFGHIVRANGMELDLALGKTEGKRRRGRQRMRWTDSICKTLDMTIREAWKLCRDRKEWRGLIHRVTRGRTRPDGT